LSARTISKIPIAKKAKARIYFHIAIAYYYHFVRIISSRIGLLKLV